MSFSPTNDATKVITIEFLTNFLHEWGLFKAFEENKITFSVDGALYTTARDLYLKNNLIPRVNICVPHNFGNTSKRSLDENLKTYWPEGPSKIQVIFLFSSTKMTCHDRSLSKILRRRIRLFLRQEENSPITSNSLQSTNPIYPKLDHLCERTMTKVKKSSSTKLFQPKTQSAFVTLEIDTRCTLLGSRNLKQSRLIRITS